MPRNVLRTVAEGALVLALISPVVPVAVAQATPTAPGPPPVYLALGNSYAAGVGASDFVPPRSTRLGYVPRFAEFLRGAAHGGVRTTVNLTVPGETTASFLAPGGQWAAAQAAIADPTTDVRVVTLTLGGNDLLYLLGPGQPCEAGVADPQSPACRAAIQAALAAFPESYAPVLATLFGALAAEDAAPEQVIVTTYPNPFSGTPDLAFAAAVDTALLGKDLTIDCSALAEPLKRRAERPRRVYQPAGRRHGRGRQPGVRGQGPGPHAHQGPRRASQQRGLRTDRHRGANGLAPVGPRRARPARTVAGAGLALGLLWATWHIGPDRPGAAAAWGALWPWRVLTWMFAGMVPYRVLMTWVYRHTRSVLLAVLMHAAYSGGQVLLAPGGTGQAQDLLWWGLLGLALGAVAGLVALADRAHLLRPAPVPPGRCAPAG